MAPLRLIFSKLLRRDAVSFRISQLTGDDISVPDRSTFTNAIKYIIIIRILLELGMDQALYHYVQLPRDDLPCGYTNSNILHGMHQSIFIFHPSTTPLTLCSPVSSPPGKIDLPAPSPPSVRTASPHYSRPPTPAPSQTPHSPSQ